jgi:hypothetical protein
MIFLIEGASELPPAASPPTTTAKKVNLNRHNASCGGLPAQQSANRLNYLSFNYDDPRFLS